MQNRLALWMGLLVLPTAAVAQTPPAAPAQTQPRAPAQTQPTAPAQTQPRARAANVTLAVQVTDRTGTPIGDAQVGLAGPVDRSGTTAADGTITFRGLRGGTYRLRFEREEFTTLERELVVSGTQRAAVSVALTPAPRQPQPRPEPQPQQVAPVPSRPRGAPAEPRVLSIPDFLDENLVRSEPQKTSLLACAPGGTARLVQIRDPLENQLHNDVDEVLYVVAGDGVVRIRDAETKVSAGFFALVPGGSQHSIRRQGRNPLILLSVLAGTPCVEQGR